MHSEKRNRIGVGMLLVSLVFACSSSLYIPKVSAGISKEELKAMQLGRAAYINKCGGCHSLVLPEKYGAAEWKFKVKQMSSKAHLSPLEEENILKYLTKNDSSLQASHR